MEWNSTGRITSSSWPWGSKEIVVYSTQLSLGLQQSRPPWVPTNVMGSPCTALQKPYCLCRVSGKIAEWRRHFLMSCLAWDLGLGLLWLYIKQLYIIYTTSQAELHLGGGRDIIPVRGASCRAGLLSFLRMISVKESKGKFLLHSDKMVHRSRL